MHQFPPVVLSICRTLNAGQRDVQFAAAEPDIGLYLNGIRVCGIYDPSWPERLHQVKHFRPVQRTDTAVRSGREKGSGIVGGDTDHRIRLPDKGLPSLRCAAENQGMDHAGDSSFLLVIHLTNFVLDNI